MNKEAVRIMREEEEIMLDIVKSAKKAEAHGLVMRPVGLEAARILVDLLRIEAMIKEEYDPYAQ